MTKPRVIDTHTVLCGACNGSTYEVGTTFSMSDGSTCVHYRCSKPKNEGCKCTQTVRWM